MLIRPITPGFSCKTTAATASSRVAFGADVGESVVVYNAAAIPIYVALGTSSVTALIASATPKASCHAIPPTSVQTLTREPTTQTHIALISSGVIATVYISTGEGKPT